MTNEYAQPLTTTNYHERPQWKQVTDRGVVILNDCRIKPDDLMPRVVIRGAMVVEAVRQCFTIGPIGSRSDYLTVAFGGDEAVVTTGCFTGTLDAFDREIKMKPADRDREEYEAALAFLRVIETTRCKRKAPEPNDAAPIAWG